MTVTQEIFWAVAASTALITAILGLWQAYQNYRQRRNEYRWKKAEMAKAFIDEFLTDPLDYPALRILDGIGSRIAFGDGTVVSARPEDLIAAFRRELDSGQGEAGYLYEAADAVVYYLDYFGHFVDIGLVDFYDVENPWRYYAYILRPYQQDLEAYADATQRPKAVMFLRRFWET